MWRTNVNAESMLITAIESIKEGKHDLVSCNYTAKSLKLEQK